MKIKWRRLLRNPTVHVESRDGDTTRLRIDGLVCDTVCAVRTKQALEAMPGTTAVDIDYEAGTATITGAPHDERDYDDAVGAVVAGRPLRRLLEHLTHRRHDAR